MSERYLGMFCSNDTDYSGDMETTAFTDVFDSILRMEAGQALSSEDKQEMIEVYKA